jgi:hypothetical protein
MWTMRVLLLAAGVVSAACNSTASATAITEAKVSDLEKSLKTLEERIKAVEVANSLDDLAEDRTSMAYLTPGAEGYSVVRMDLGHLTFQLTNVEAYASGSRVTFRVGNVTSATMNRVKATLEWRSVDENGSPGDEAARSRAVEFSRTLGAGAWTSVPVVLEGVPPPQLGFVRVKDVSHAGISLAR